MIFHNTEKTEIRYGNAPKFSSFIRRQDHNGKVVDRNWLCFLLHQLVFIVSLVDWCAQIQLNVRIPWLEKESATGSTFLKVWEATSKQCKV